MAKWGDIYNQTKLVSENVSGAIDGYNHPLAVKDNLSYASMNLTDYTYPYMYVRNGLQRIAYTGIPSLAYNEGSMGYYMSKDIALIGGSTSILYDKNSTFTDLQTGSNYQSCNFHETNVNSTTFPMMIISNGSSTPIMWDGTSTVAAVTGAPSTKIMASHARRMFFASGKTITYSALNKLTDYTTANDAGTIVISSPYNISAMVEYNNNLIIFTTNSMHMLVNTSPSNFAIIDIQGNVGCANEKCVTICDRKMYFIHEEKINSRGKRIFEYTGGVPVLISKPSQGNNVMGSIEKYLNDWVYYQNENMSIESANACVYITISRSSNTYNLIFYTNERRWYIWDNLVKTSANKGNDFLIGLDKDNKIVELNDSLAVLAIAYWKNSYPPTPTRYEKVAWYNITKGYSVNNGSETLTVSQITVRYMLEYSTSSTNSESTMYLDYTTELDSQNLIAPTTTYATSTQFKRIHEFAQTNGKTNTVTINLPSTSLANVSSYALKLHGVGAAAVLNMSQKVKYNERRR